jgi:hypothetical protein
MTNDIFQIKSMNWKNVISPLVSTAFFVALVIFWGFYYPNHLVQKEQMQLFLTDWVYFVQHLSVKGGLATYLGEFFTQFFLFPIAGDFIVSAVLFSIYFGIKYLLKQLYGNELSLLALVPAIGYGFLLCNDFYYLSGAIAVSLSVWAVVGYLRIKSPASRAAIGFVGIPILYWFLGGAYMLFGTSVVLSELIIYFSKSNRLTPIKSMFLYISVCTIWGVVVPLVARRFLLLDTFLQSYVSSAFYKFTLIFPAYLKLVFASVPVLIIFHYFLLKLSRKIRFILQLTSGVLLIGALAYGFKKVPDFSEEKEMKYSNLVNKQDWTAIIKQAEKELPQGTQGKLSLTLALGQTNQLCSRLFAFSPQQSDFFIPYKVHGMAPLVASEPYFYLGFINFAQMLAMESIDSSPDAVMPVRAVKRYAETCIVTGQYDVAAKFLSYLKRTLFYRDWANEASEYLYNDEKVKAHPLWGKLRASQPKDEFNFQFDQMDAMLFSLLRSNQQNRLAYEYLMSSYLLQKDLDKFLEFLPLVKTMNYPELPLAFQEALVYAKTLLPEWPEALKAYPIASNVSKRIEEYARAFSSGGNKNAAAMKRSFGNTYWYYVHFSDIHGKN